MDPMKPQLTGMIQDHDCIQELKSVLGRSIAPDMSMRLDL